MTQFFERHLRLIKKDQELQRLFEAADRRRKLLLQNDDRDDKNGASDGRESISNYLLRPLTRADDRSDSSRTDQTVKIATKSISKSCAYLSFQDLPETNLDSDEFSIKNDIHSPNNNQEIFLNSVDNVNRIGYHNSSFATSSSSSGEIDTSNYCQFYPATSSSNNTTNSSHLSRNFQDNSKLVDDTKTVGEAQAEADFDNNCNRRSSVLFYPSGSPLISHKYQGSPVVRIDNKIRAGEVDYLVDVPKIPHGKPPAVPRHKPFSKSPISTVLQDDKHLSQPNLDYISEDSKPCSSSFSPPNSNNTQSTIIRRTKRKMLEEHMRKRFSTGDYSTRSLIEWENNLNLSSLELLSASGDLPSDKKYLSRQSSCEPGALCSISNQLQNLPKVHNYASEINIVHYSSSESFKETQVSFSLKNTSIESKDKHKRSGFLQRSLNDIFMAFKNVTASEKFSGSKKFLFPSNKSSFHFRHSKIHRKRGSITSDFLYSVPPFARKHLPPDISGGTKLMSQESYLANNLPSSTPNLIAEIDPTFHERCNCNDNQNENQSIRQPNSKRNRSYRLSFIENAHTVTTKKLTSTNLTSPSKTVVPRFVQPRRRIGSRNSTTGKRSGNSKQEPGNSRSAHTRSHSSNRFSCIQQ